MMKEFMKKKKEYFAPSIQVIEMENSCSILAASGEESKDDYDDWGPGYGTNDPRYPGQGL